MATIEERTTLDGEKRFRVVVRKKGRPAQRATFTRLTDARKWARQTESAIEEGRHFKTQEARRHTLAEMIDRYLKDVMPRKRLGTQGAQRTQLLWWKERLGAYTLADVTPALIAEARDHLLSEATRKSERRSPATTLRYIAALSHVFTVAMKEWGWVEDNPCRKVTKPKEPAGRVRFLSEDERDRLLTACRESRQPALYDVVVLAMSTGMRRGEIMHLTWDAVDLDRGMILLAPEKTKTGERRAVPLVGHALERMKARARIRRIDTTYVFAGTRKPGQKAKPVDLQAAWIGALERAGIEGFVFHDLRHTAASYLAMNGASIAEIAAVLGHKTLAMVQRYSHLSQAHTSAVVARMNEAMFSGVAESEADHG